MPPPLAWNWKRVLGVAILLASTTFIILAYAFSHPLVDFVVYWTAGHLFVAHVDVYSLPAVFHFQKSVGLPGDVPLMFLSPPWMLPLIAPLGYANSYALSWLVWLAVLASAAAVSSRLLMDLYFGPLRIPEISDPSWYRYLFVFTFYPVLLSLKLTQLGAFLLLGVAGFAYYQSRNRPFIAGAFLSLSLLKPHLFLLLLLALLLRREWRVLASATALVSVLSGIALRHDHGIFREYWVLMNGPYPRIALSGILAGVRIAFEPHDTYWLQFVPPVIGLVWFFFYWRQHRDSWVWLDRLPVLLTASLIAAPYGYVHDQFLLMVPIIALAAASARRSGYLPLTLVTIYTILNLLILLVAVYSTQWCILAAPVVVSAMLYRMRGSEVIESRLA